ncbi:MAG TPA: cobyric acid synthase, partial [Blastocatellia bacterium]
MKNRRARALMILGTASHVGKSITTAALCRIFHQEGFNVAPFKAQNIALNSFATREGDEIGRAQAVQAQAAGVEPHVDMNPILLKPSSGSNSQIILNGKVFGKVSAANFEGIKPQLFSAAVQAYERLSARHDFIILEGAGSPVEMNLKDGDIVNLKMAEVTGAACVLVADIDRGGVFASLVGTYELLTPGERKRFGGFLINRFRGDVSRFRSGVDFLEMRLKQPCLGVVPYLPELRIDEEDSVALEDVKNRRAAERMSPDRLRVCVIHLPHISNFNDFTPLEMMPGISVFYARAPYESGAADVLILPGSKNTIADLSWMRTTGWTEVITEHAAGGKPILGICGGFQMLGREVFDPFHVESEAGCVSGLGLLDVTTTLGREKITRQARAELKDSQVIGIPGPGPCFEGYEIHMGETRLGPKATPFFTLTRVGAEDSILDGAISADGRVIGTYLHGVFDSADGASALLAHLRRMCGEVSTSERFSFGIDRE